MTISYRIDYQDGDQIVPVFDLTRTDAMSLARKMSKKHGSAYAIASQNGQDIGQKVYHDGRFSHADDSF